MEGIDMDIFRALNKKDEKIFYNIAKKDKAFIIDVSITRNLPRRYPSLFDKNNGFFEIYRSERNQKSVILPRDDSIKLIPITDPDSIRIKSSRLRKFGVLRIF